MASSGSNKKVANSLVTLSSAAILVVYAAGFMKTRAAAQRIEDSSNDRPPVMPAPATAGETTPAAPIAPPAPVTKPLATPAATSAKTAVMPKSPAVVVPKATKADTNPGAAPTPTPSPAPTPSPVAVASTPATAPVMKVDDAPAPALKRPKEIYADGTYLGWGTSRHGEIQASVKIEDGRIVTVAIAQCWTNYSCSWIAHLPAQVVTRQSPDVDYVSGATQSANALYWAVVDALNKAK